MLEAPQADLFRLASRLVIREVDDVLVGALAAPATREALDALAPGCGDWVTEWDEAGREAAAVEYATLFLVPSPKTLNLRVGSWLPETDEAIAARVEELMAPLGLDLSSAGAGELPRDHLGVVLALVADLLDSPSAQAREQASPLVRRMICPWIADFASFLEERATIPLYRATAALLVELAALHGPVRGSARVPRADPDQ